MNIFTVGKTSITCDMYADRIAFFSDSLRILEEMFTLFSLGVLFSEKMDREKCDFFTKNRSSENKDGI